MAPSLLRRAVAFALLASVGLAAPARADADPKLPAPKVVTYCASDQPLSKVLAELARQTGVTVEDRRGEADTPVSVDLKGVTFWRAVDEIAEAAGARLDLYAKDGKLALVKRPPDYRPPPSSYDGLFRLALKRVVTARDLESDGGTCTVTLEVAWPPDLRPLLLETQPQKVRLLGPDRKPVEVAAEGSSLAPVDRRPSFTFDVALPPLPRSAQSIALFEGQLTAVGPNKMLTFTFDPLARLALGIAGGAPPSRTQEGVVCRIDKVVLAKKRWTVRVRLEYPPGGARLESYQSWVVHNEMTLVSADGRQRLPSSSYVLESSSSRRAVLSYHFTERPGRPLGKPADWKVAYRTPALIVEMPIKFAFKDIPLP
jgi:hypothetical protein